MTAPALDAFRELVHSWHEFYLLAGTAAVTLVGLLFVALSIHLDVLLHHKRAHLLDLARQTLLAFIWVLVISLVFLIPPSVPRVLAFTMGMSTVIVLVFALIGLAGELRTGAGTVGRRTLVRRRLVQVFSLTLALYAVFKIWKGDPEALFIMVGPICAMLGNATGTAWDLVVQVGRLKVRDEGAIS